MENKKKKVPPVTVPFTPFESPEDLAAFVVKLQGKRWDALLLGAKRGFSATCVDVLRQVLDYTGSKKNGISKDLKNEILERAKNGAFAVDLAKEYNIDFHYLYQFLNRRGLMNKKNDFWTNRKIMQLCVLMFNGKTDAENAAVMGISRCRYCGMKGRLQRRVNCARWVPLAEKMGIYNHA